MPLLSALIPRFTKWLMLKSSLRVLSAALWVLSALIMSDAHFSKPTCQQHMPLQHSSPKGFSSPLYYCLNSAQLPGVSFCPLLIEGGKTLFAFSFTPIWQSPKNFQNLILPLHIFPAICAMKFPFLFFLPSISSYHALTMH